MKIRKLISLLAATAMTVTALMGAMSVSVVSAADTVTYATSGTWGSNGEWVLSDDGTLSITGTGELGANALTPKLEVGLLKSVNRLVVGEGITNIKDNFTGSGAIQVYATNEVVLPSTLTGELDFRFTGFGTIIKDVYIYSRNVQISHVPDPGDTIFHVYKDSEPEKILRSIYDYTDEDIVYIEGERPQEPEPVPVELEPLKETSGPAGLSSKYEWNETSKTLTFSGKGAISMADYNKNQATNGLSP